jgi:predicted Zn-dependent protease
LAYALNPRHDQSAVNLAQLLADLGAPERAWEIVGETLTRNPSYEPAWALLESLEAQR